MSNGITSLHRPDQGRWLAGVAAGLGRRFGVPVWIVRIAFALLCFAGGLGALLYVAGWLLIPREGETDAIVQGWLGTGQARRWVGVILVGLAVIILGTETRLIRGELAVAVVLIGIGVMLYRGDLGSTDRRPAATPPSGGATPTDTVGDTAVVPRVSPPVPAAGPPRDRSYLGRITVGFAVMALGLLGLFDSVLPGFHPRFRHYVALFVVVIGLGLLIGAWFGRSGGLAALGILLIPVLVLSPLTDLADSGSFEFDFTSTERTHYRPASVEQIRDAYRLGAGSLLIDLRDVDFRGRTVEVEARVGMGEVLVRLPDGVSADVNGRVGMGVVQVEDREHGGIGVEADYRLEGSDGTLVLDAEVGLGQVVVSYWPVYRHIYRIWDEADLLDDFSLDQGSLRLDLSDLVLQDDKSVAIDVGRGEVWVTVPRNLGLRVSTRVDQGRVTIFDEGRSGSNLYEEHSIQLMGTPRLTLDIRVGHGSVIVEKGQ